MPKIVDHEQYRKELLGKCFDLFADKGYGAITMRQIANSLEVSTGTLYHYFPSKQALFEQLVEEISQQDVMAALAELG
jgi:AcrR family transcriptional regulator